MKPLLILALRCRARLNGPFHPKFASHLRRRLGQLRRVRIAAAPKERGNG